MLSLGLLAATAFGAAPASNAPPLPSATDRLAVSLSEGIRPLPHGSWRSPDAIEGAVGMLWGEPMPEAGSRWSEDCKAIEGVPSVVGCMYYVTPNGEYRSQRGIFNADLAFCRGHLAAYAARMQALQMASSTDPTPTHPVAVTSQALVLRLGQPNFGSIADGIASWNGNDVSVVMAPYLNGDVYWHAFVFVRWDQMEPCLKGSGRERMAVDDYFPSRMRQALTGAAH